MPPFLHSPSGIPPTPAPPSCPCTVARQHHLGCIRQDARGAPGAGGPCGCVPPTPLFVALAPQGPPGWAERCVGRGTQGLPWLRGPSWRDRYHRDGCRTRVWMPHQGEALARAHRADVEGGFVRDRPGVTLLWPEWPWQGMLPSPGTAAGRGPGLRRWPAAGADAALVLSTAAPLTWQRRGTACPRSFLNAFSSCVLWPKPIPGTVSSSPPQSRSPEVAT